MSFMQKEITEKIWWLIADGTNGVECAPLDVFMTDIDKAFDEVERMTDEDDFTLVNDYFSCGASGMYSLEIAEGYGCRMSAPGYLDCTDWTVFGTVEACNEYLDIVYKKEKYLDEVYGEEE